MRLHSVITYMLRNESYFTLCGSNSKTGIIH